MNYKIVSSNKDLIFQVKTVFTSLNMNEAIHIQEVDFWLIDVKTLDKTSILSYKNKNEHSNLLFVVNNDEHIQTCLNNGFLFYIKSNFSNLELSSWCKYFLNKNKPKEIVLQNNASLNLQKKELKYLDKNISLTLQEIAFLNAINSNIYVNTQSIATMLNLTSTTSVRTIVNRIRKKAPNDIILHKRNFGYKLNISDLKPLKSENNSHIKELEEQNNLMQEIVDSSPIFIATFVHKQLYCINKSFRQYLGNEIIKELWDETKGDFFQLIKHSSKNKEALKENIFKNGSKNIKIYDFTSKKDIDFEVKTFYFEKIDKHLLIFQT